MLGASPEHFTEGRDEINPQRVREFTGKTVEFLREQYGGRCVKAVLHMDEKTPHVQAFVVPIDERGRLNCKSFFGSREKLRRFQDAFAEKMRPLGLERGMEGSRATHTDVQRFYGAIKEEVRLRVAPERVPDPPRMMVTEASRKEYKRQVVKAISEQIHEPVNTLSKQAKLTREEKGKREAAEKRAADAERRAKEWGERFLAEQKENIAFHHRTRELEADIAGERKQKAELGKHVEGLSRQVQALTNRVQDIPLIEVMRSLGYQGEQKDGSTVYRDARGQAALTITGDKAARGDHVIARNAVDLVAHVRREHQGVETTPAKAITWLAEKFGREGAVAAAVVHTEQAAAAIVMEHERRREAERTPAHEQRQEHAHSRAQAPGRGGFSR